MPLLKTSPPTCSGCSSSSSSMASCCNSAGAGSARAPLTDHSRVDAGASRCSHSTAVMPATCSGSTVCTNTGASVSHSTHVVSRTLKCARDMSHFSQEEMHSWPEPRCGRRVIARTQQSQHEPACLARGACADSNRGHRPRRPRRPGRSDGRDEFTVCPQLGTTSV